MTVVQLRPTVTLGGSTAAAAAGIDPYRSRVMLWCELTGRVERLPSEAMAWGKRLQAPIMDELTETFGYVIDTEPGEYRNGEWPWLAAHPDAICANADLTEPAVLEVKTAGPFAGKWGDDPPVQYVAQCQVYMHLTGIDRALLACLVGGQRLELRHVAYDARVCGLLLERMAAFVGFVERDEPPPPDGSDSARDALAAMFPAARADRLYRLTQSEYRAYLELLARREQAKAIDVQVTELENRLKLAMGDADTAITPNDKPALHWRNVTSNRLDAARLKAELPHVHSDYLTTTDTRRFTVA